MLQPGDTIKIFDKKDYRIYMNWVHRQGFKCTFTGDKIIVKQPLKKQIDKSETAKSISRVRRANKMSRDTMAQVLEVNRDTIWKWESGLCMPDKNNQQRLKEKLGWEGFVYKGGKHENA